MENYLNQRKDKIFFPYEYGTAMYDEMREPIFGLLRREELAPNIGFIYKHLEDSGVIFSSPGGSFKRKFLCYLSQYMNSGIRTLSNAEMLKNNDKLRELLEPLAKIICQEKYGY